MAKVQDLTVEVKAKMTVDRKTAEACLKLVEMFVNESGVWIECNREANGEKSFQFIDSTSRTEVDE